jgi:hypothetical protein
MLLSFGSYLEAGSAFFVHDDQNKKDMKLLRETVAILRDELQESKNCGQACQITLTRKRSQGQADRFI